MNIVNKQNMINRLKKRKSLNRYDKFNTFFYQKVQKGFLKIAKKKSKKYKIIDSNLGTDKNKQLVIRNIDRLI